MFHPSGPNLRRSCSCAWKNAQANTSRRHAATRLGGASAGPSSSSGGMSPNVRSRFDLTPCGGSIVTCRGDPGHAQQGSVWVSVSLSLLGCAVCGPTMWGRGAGTGAPRTVRLLARPSFRSMPALTSSFGKRFLCQRGNSWCAAGGPRAKCMKQKRRPVEPKQTCSMLLCHVPHIVYTRP
eukprot:351397-Chlamydomonas_euryale.AAC.8